MIRTAIGLFLLLICTQAMSQTIRDHASLSSVAYPRGIDSVELEVYYSVVQKSLRFTTTNEKKWTTSIRGKIIVLQEGKQIDEVVINKTKTFEGSKETLAAHGYDLIIDGAIFRIAAKTNTQVSLLIEGVDTVLLQPVNITPHKSDKSQFGGVELASSIEKSTDKNNFFDKAGYVVLPNPSSVFGENSKKLYYYTEIALAKGISGPDAKGQVVARIIDPKEHEVLKTSQEVLLPTDEIPIMGSLAIEGLPTDSYLLELSFIRNNVTEALIQRSFYYNSGIQLSEEEEEAPLAQSGVDEQTIYLTSDFSRLGEFELLERGDQTRYMMSESKKTEYKKLTDLEAKRKFLFDFWRAKDTEAPNSQPLAIYSQFLRRVDAANKQYTHMKTPGWKTGRGRVLIQYGPPDEIQRQPFSIDTKPYMFWQYIGHNIPLQFGSRAEFVFVDKQGGGNFVLVHSNVRGETSEPDWYSREALQTTN